MQPTLETNIPQEENGPQSCRSRHHRKRHGMV
jgi:hypothetical protein